MNSFSHAVLEIVSLLYCPSYFEFLGCIWSQPSKWGQCLTVERLISLSLSENQFILCQFLVECILISFERIWKFQFSWFVNCSRFEINKKKMTSWLEWLMFIHSLFAMFFFLAETRPCGAVFIWFIQNIFLF